MSDVPNDPPDLALPIDWHVPENLTTRYATHFVVQQTAQEFILSFFEIMPPIILGDDTEQRQAFTDIGSIRANCVGRIVCSPVRAAALIDILQQNLESFRARYIQEGEDRHDG